MYRRAGVGAACAALCFVAIALAEDENPSVSHLRFFHDNRSFVLNAFEKLPLAERTGPATGRNWSFDPFTDWNAAASVAHARAGLDTATAPEHLGAFHATLEQLLQDTARAAARLDELDVRFAQHLRTALEVTLAAPRRADVERLEAWLDGRKEIEHTLNGAERAALASGGVFEVLRRVVEPRAQPLEVRAWFRGASEPQITQYTVRPQVDRLVRVHLDFAAANEAARLEQTTLGGSP